MSEGAELKYPLDMPILVPVFIDASILEAPFVRDILFHLAEQDLFSLHWTVAVENEWMNSAIAFGAPAQKVRRCLDGLRQAAPSWQVHDFQKHVTLFKDVLPHRRHLAAAAYALSLKGECARPAIIVTTDMDSLPIRAFRDSRVKLEHIDDFICNIYQEYPTRVLKTIECCRNKLKILNLSKAQYLQALYNDGCQRFAIAAAVYWKVKLKN